jgi:hypothetical protein
MRASSGDYKRPVPPRPAEQDVVSAWDAQHLAIFIPYRQEANRRLSDYCSCHASVVP